MVGTQSIEVGTSIASCFHLDVSRIGLKFVTTCIGANVPSAISPQ